MSMTQIRPSFSSPTAIPPGGRFFCELAGRRYEGKTLSEVCEAIRPELARLQIRMPPEDFVAAYMCPRMGPAGSWFCKGLSRSAVSSFRPADVMSTSERYFGRRVVSSDEVSARLERCLSCPKHERRWCLTCPGHLARILDGFGKSRSRVALDPKSGVCTCVGAYESAVCSVKYDLGERIWPGVPRTCWRFDNDG